MYIKFIVCFLGVFVIFKLIIWLDIWVWVVIGNIWFFWNIWKFDVCWVCVWILIVFEILINVICSEKLIKNRIILYLNKLNLLFIIIF